MGKSRKGINPNRLKTIYSRQKSPIWDSSYLPSILATPQEAPSISRAYTLTPAKFDMREVHLISTPEMHAALLGLHYPNVVGLQEQRMLSPEPTVHPLWNFQGVDRLNLPPLKGVIDVAERLGYSDLLPKVKIENPKLPGEFKPIVFPWIGDLLWAISPSPGKIYCVNWTIKSEY